MAEALSKVAKERPQDPIQYVADYLHNLKTEGDDETLRYEELAEQQNLESNIIRDKNRDPTPILSPSPDRRSKEPETEPEPKASYCENKNAKSIALLGHLGHNFLKIPILKTSLII